MLIFECSSCQAKMQAADEHAGKKTVCPECGAKVNIPSDGAITADPVSSASAPTVPDGITTPERARAASKAADRDRDDEDDRRPRRRDRSSSGAGASVGMSVGLILAIVLGVGGCVAVIGVALVIFAISRVREAAARTQTVNNMKQIGLAFHGYHDSYKKMPAPRAQPAQFGAKPAELSWRVSLLPFLEQQGMFNQFDQASGWDHMNNNRFLAMRPMVYDHPLRAEPNNTKTTFQYFTGTDTLFPDQDRPKYKINTIPDGSSNTFMFAEAQLGVPWSQPADMVMPSDPLPLPPDRFLATMCDGTVRMVDRRKVSDRTIRMVINPNDNVPLPVEWN